MEEEKKQEQEDTGFKQFFNDGLTSILTAHAEGRLDFLSAFALIAISDIYQVVELVHNSYTGQTGSLPGLSQADKQNVAGMLSSLLGGSASGTDINSMLAKMVGSGKQKLNPATLVTLMNLLNDQKAMGKQNEGSDSHSGSERSDSHDHSSRERRR